MHQEKFNEIENFYSGVLKKINKKAKTIATSPKTGKVIGNVYSTVNPTAKLLNKASDELFKSGNFKSYLIGGGLFIIIIIIAAIVINKIMK